VKNYLDFHTCTQLNLGSNKMMLKNISLRLLINGSLAIVAFFAIIWLSYLSWGAYQDNIRMNQLERANNMADKIIEASVFNALERGLTATALSTPDTANAAMIAKINERSRNYRQRYRQTGSQGFRHAYSARPDCQGT
jgi:hypothetical protein